MIYRFRIILDVNEDVLRDIEIEETATLEELHHAITQAFGFLGNEMASFYRSDQEWTQGEEMSLEAMDPTQESFGDQALNSVICADQHHLIYVYDFLNLWTFFVELMEVGGTITGTTYPNLIHALGEVPEEAPVKLFESELSTENTEETDLDGENSDDYDDSPFY